MPGPGPGPGPDPSEDLLDCCHEDLGERESRRYGPARGELSPAQDTVALLREPSSFAAEAYFWFLISELACSMLPLTSSVFTSDFCPARRPTSVSNV